MATHNNTHNHRYSLSVLLLSSTIALTPMLTTQDLAYKIVSPVHSPYQPTTVVISQISPYCTQALHVPVGPPNAVLSVVVVEPVLRGKDSNNNDMGSCPPEPAHVPNVIGTILLLPGYGMPKAALLPYSTALAAEGYCAVLVDLRAQGESTGNYLGYGKQEAQDLVQLIHYLKQHRLVAGRIGLLGISYGAAVALDTAAIDERIAAVVAVGPFGRVSLTIRRFLEMGDPQLSATISAPMLQQAIKQAGHLVGYPLAAADPLLAVSAIRAPVLYLAGGQDPVATLQGIRELATRTANAELVVETKANHVLLTSDVTLIEKYAIPWLKHNLEQSPGRVLPHGRRNGRMAPARQNTSMRPRSIWRATHTARATMSAGLNTNRNQIAEK